MTIHMARGKQCVRYLTKEWYELCQQRSLEFGLRAHRGADVHDEALYRRLYKRKEKAFLKEQREMYDVDPRYLLAHDGAEMIRVDQYFSGEEIADEDKLIYHMPEEEKVQIHKRIAEYDARPAFDEVACKQEFQQRQEWGLEIHAERLPGEILQQIADLRVFTLGYCTKDMLRQLKELSIENVRKTDQISQEYRQAQQAEPLPEELRNHFHFHDCTVTEMLSGDDLVIRLDTQGGFTQLNKITFVAPDIIKQDEGIVGKFWLYNELYRTDDGYEAHVLLDGKEMAEFIVRCRDIIIEQE